MSYVFRSTAVEPRARGMEFGAKHARQIQATIAAYCKLFARATDRAVELEPFGREALAATKAFAPKLLEEMEGMAAGAGIDPALIGAINARTEILAALGAKNRGECSAVVRVDRGGEGPAAVQTWDWYAELADQWLVWEIPQADGSLTTTVTEFGVVGKIGVNSRGLGVLFTILHHERDGERIGVPVHVASRAVLDSAANINRALQLLARADVSASSSVTVISTEDDLGVAASVELYPGGPDFVFPAPDGLLVRTNHFLSARAQAGDTEPRSFPDTLLRHDLLVRRLSGVKRLDVAQILTAMSSHVGGDGAVCCHHDPLQHPTAQFETLATVVLDVAGGSLQVFEGGPCRQPAVVAPFLAHRRISAQQPAKDAIPC
ncbi:C45 family autoproteolytic acyltransferase/hydolase [Hypericibacter sp.]|uniref:C45 family autoproteolytic acyltransferase/hydolase n=1 Tax=Hypericibacter sp. TaxID=2705401 RepID=UPI003D6DA128